MQKFLKIAEQHVQWLALALGVTYLLWMGYSYAYQNSLVVSLGIQKVQPGELDTAIVNGPIKTLDEQMANTTPITITPPDVLSTWGHQVTDATAIVSNLNPVFPLDVHGNEIFHQGGGPVENVAVIKALPVPPEPDFLAIAAYRTEVQYPDPNFVAPPPDGNNPPAVAPTIKKDLDAVSVEFTVPTQKLVAAFKNAFQANFQNLAQTMYLQINLYREEQDANGKWGPPTLVPPLKIHVMSPYPGDKPPTQPGVIYQAWAGGNQQDIVEPTFYDVAAGDPPWFAPDAPPVVAPPPPPAPVAPPAGAPGTAPPPAAFRPGGPKTHDDPSLALPAPALAPKAPIPQPAPPPADAAATAGPHYSAGAFQNAGGAGLNNVFNLLQKNTDDIILAHDDSVQPEKTYRYFVQYRLLNPLFGNNRLFANLASTFALVSPGPDKVAAAAGDTITIPPRTQIYVKSILSNSVTFAVFVWSPAPHETQIVATPGDSITPAWSLVDIRPDPKSKGNFYVILVDQAGKQQRRDPQTDQADPKFHDLETLVNGAAAASAQ
jgi:hypothetical protein